jgi:hypothetical protein
MRRYPAAVKKWIQTMLFTAEELNRTGSSGLPPLHSVNIVKIISGVAGNRGDDILCSRNVDPGVERISAHADAPFDGENKKDKHYGQNSGF